MSLQKKFEKYLWKGWIKLEPKKGFLKVEFFHNEWICSVKQLHQKSKQMIHLSSSALSFLCIDKKIIHLNVSSWLKYSIVIYFIFFETLSFDLNPCTIAKFIELIMNAIIETQDVFFNFMSTDANQEILFLFCSIFTLHVQQ